MEKTVPMVRLLEGDVGAGKTLVAVAAALPVVQAGGQVAFLAPTEILAQQQVVGVQKLLEGMSAEHFPPDKGGLRGVQKKEVKYIKYNHNLTDKARELRKNPTPMEKQVWSVLSRQQFEDLKFTQQKPLDHYIVDFYCAELMLAIEVDGDSHAHQVEYDIKRTKDLEDLGVKVIRYTNADIVNNLDGVYEDLMSIVERRRIELTPPAPLVRGEDSVPGPDQDSSAKVELLTGSITGKEREAILTRVKSGETQVLVGTHALLEPWVQFQKLGLVVIDEQHRFGVHQRDRLIVKGSPHVLQMTATPIPRTLAIVAFGDQELSVLNELPPHRKPIHTKVVSPSGRTEIERFLHSEISKGRQAFVIAPLVEESERLEDVKSATTEFERMEQVFPEFKIGLLHGKMKSVDKEQTMQDFKGKKYHILVSTAVVEVGVDVPNATMMIIEGAERFGLAQLHQFRGRVGRGEHQSYCFLFPTEKPTQRLKAMQSTTCGFELAEIDLQLRGSGELYGTRQSGLMDFRVANITDGRLVLQARNAAKEFLQKVDYDLLGYPELQKAVKEVKSEVRT